MKYLLNAISCSMVPQGATLIVEPITEPQARNFLVGVETLDRAGQAGETPHAWLDGQSAVGHADTAAVISGILGVTVPVNRVSVKLAPGEDSAIIAQYAGPRLPEGATRLPEGAKIDWFFVRSLPLFALEKMSARVVKLEKELLDVFGEEGVERLL